MIDPGTIGTTARPDEDRPAPMSRRRSVPLRLGLLTGLVAAVVLTAGVVVATSGARGPAAAETVAIATVTVDGTDPVERDGTTVTTPCFSYHLPEGLELDGRSAGCATAVGFGSDSLTQIRVQATTGSADFDEVVAAFRQDASRPEELESDTVTVAGLDTLQLRSVDGWGVPRASYLVPLPVDRFTQAGKDLTGIWLTGPASPEFDAWMDTVLDSLEIRGG
jgi:hypothetical protein